MEQPGAVIESELLDLTGLSLNDMRARRQSREWHEVEQRLLLDLSNPAINVATHQPNSWTM